MASVANRVRELEQKRLRALMSPRLAFFLETCWAFRNEAYFREANGKLDMYLLYCNRFHSQEDRPKDWVHGASQSIPRFFEGLVRIRSGYQIRIQPYCELGKKYGRLGNVLKLAEKKEGEKKREEIDDRLMIARILNLAQRKPDVWGPLLWDLGMSFVHFVRDESLAMRRVYLNVRPECRVQVCEFLVRASIPEAVRFKVVGPLQKGYDTIVIYITNDHGVVKVLSELAEYQKWFSAYFDFPVINIAKPAKHAGKLLRGVAVASEPGDFERIDPINKANPSFGDFWERLLLPCFEKADEANSETMFFELALKTMEKLRINPMYPHKFLHD